jgi:hypothetical protein
MGNKTGYEPWPLDYKLLELLPDAGIIGGVHYKGRRARDLLKEITSEIGEGILNIAQLQSRLRVLKMNGYAEKFPASGGDIWARTSEGVKFLRSNPLFAREEQDGKQESAEA